MIYDTAYPDNYATGSLTVSVVRNANAPLFSQDEYSKSLDDQFPIGEDVLEVQATDLDQVMHSTPHLPCSHGYQLTAWLTCYTPLLKVGLI